MIAFVKNYLKIHMEAIPGVERVFTSPAAAANYEAPGSVIIMTQSDKLEQNPARSSRFVGTKNKNGEYNQDGRLWLYRARLTRTVTMEITVLGKEESVDAIISAAVRDMPRNIVMSGVPFEPLPDPDERAQQTGDVMVTVTAGEIGWVAEEAMSHGMVAGQLYLTFSAPVIRAEQAPEYEDVTIVPNISG